MKDYAYTDKRSVAAQLRGNGDGREIDWLAYRDNMRKVYPGSDDADLAEMYEAACERKAAA